MEFHINYDFYLPYLKNQNFNTKFNYRINKIKEQYSLKLSNDEIIKEYFVELFSWSAFNQDILKLIETVLKEHNISLVIDPSCGSAFHGYLLQEFCKFNTVNLDLQDESYSWLPIIQGDGRHYLKNLKSELHGRSALLLSWIDYQDLCLDFLDLYQGKIVISLGNYDKLSPKYIERLKHDYKLIYKIILHMPWNLNEGVEIYMK